MSQTAVLAAAQALWTELATVPVSFPGDGLALVTAPSSRLCPPGCVGLVTLGRSAIATAPDDETAERLHKRIAGFPMCGLTLETAGGVVEALQPTAILGPTALAYLAAADFRPVPTPPSLTIEELPADHPDLRALEARCSKDETDEAGIDEITSPVFAIREDDAVLAAAGYLHWPAATAHFSVLTAPAARGRGLARVAASAAVSHALVAGRLPQWRARVPASRRVAQSLGFEELGVQISAKLD